jgi:hypothetical protein
MRFCDERLQKHLLDGGEIKRVNKDYSYRSIILGNNSFEYTDNGDYYQLNRKDLEVDDWVIIEPEYDWDKIIENKILCVFSHQENFEYKMISILTKKDEDNDCYFTSQGTWYRYCKPFNPEDYKIAKDLKDYEK